MKTTRSKLLLLASTLAIAFLSPIFLSLPWYHLTGEGRSFTVYWGVVPSLPFVDSVPFAWPFAVAALLYGYCISARSLSLRWVLALGVAGVALHLLVSHVLLDATQPIPLSIYVGIYMRHAFPIIYAAFGFLLGRLLQSTATPNHALQ